MKDEADPFQPEAVEQLRVLKLVPAQDQSGVTHGVTRPTAWQYQVELWQQQPGKSKRSKNEWVVVDTRTPLRLGKPLPLIPFVFHGPKHSRPGVDSIVPLAVVQATCEMARELLIADRTASPPGEGLKSYADTTAGKTTIYDKTDTRPVISRVAQAMLIKFGALVNGKSGVARLVRA